MISSERTAGDERGKKIDKLIPYFFLRILTEKNTAAIFYMIYIASSAHDKRENS